MIDLAAAKTAATPMKLEGGVLVTRDAPNATGLASLAEQGGAAGRATPHVDDVKAEPPTGPRSAPAFVSADVKEEREAALEIALPQALSQGHMLPQPPLLYVKLLMMRSVSLFNAKSHPPFSYSSAAA